MEQLDSGGNDVPTAVHTRPEGDERLARRLVTLARWRAESEMGRARPRGRRAPAHRDGA